MRFEDLKQKRNEMADKVSKFDQLIELYREVGLDEEENPPLQPWEVNHVEVEPFIVGESLQDTLNILFAVQGTSYQTKFLLDKLESTRIGKQYHTRANLNAALGYMLNQMTKKRILKKVKGRGFTGGHTWVRR